MSTLSQFSGGGNNPYALRDWYNHQYAFDDTFIQDFTAQNDQLMISFFDAGSAGHGGGGPYVGERQSRMIKSTLNGRGDGNNGSINGLGGLPFEYGKSGISQYNSTSREDIFVNDSISNYYERENNSNHWLTIPTATNSFSPYQDWSRFIVHPTTNQLWLFKKTNGSLYLRVINTNGTHTIPTVNVGTSGLTFASAVNTGYITQSGFPTTPEINHTDNTIRCLWCSSSEINELVIGATASTVNIETKGTTGFDFTGVNFLNVRLKLAVVGSGNSTKYAICGEGQTSSGIMNVSNDDGSNWDSTAVADYYFSSPAVLGDNIYALATDRTYQWSGSYPAGRIVLPSVGVSTTISTPSWANKPLTGGTYLRSNGQGTSLYAAGGCYTTNDVYPHIVKYTE